MQNDIRGRPRRCEQYFEQKTLGQHSKLHRILKTQVSQKYLPLFLETVTLRHASISSWLPRSLSHAPLSFLIRSPQFFYLILERDIFNPTMVDTVITDDKFSRCSAAKFEGITFLAGSPPKTHLNIPFSRVPLRIYVVEHLPKNFISLKVQRIFCQCLGLYLMYQEYILRTGPS